MHRVIGSNVSLPPPAVDPLDLQVRHLPRPVGGGKDDPVLAEAEEVPLVDVQSQTLE